MYEIQNALSLNKIIEFKQLEMIKVLNSVKSLQELRNKYLSNDSIINLKSSNRDLNKSNYAKYGFNDSIRIFNHLYFDNYDKLYEEFVWGIDTIVNIERHTANRNPYRSRSFTDI